jgi:Family of unknown function (DUF5989)
MSEDKQTEQSFEQLADESSNPSFLAEFIEFLRYNKSWWLAPIIVVLLLMAGLVLLSGTAAAPFIYTLF